MAGLSLIFQHKGSMAQFYRRFVPRRVRDWFYTQRQSINYALDVYRRQRLYARWRDRRQVDALVPFAGFTAHINDGREYVTCVKTLLVWRIYAFRAQRPDPLIVDAGSNIGMSILYFKSIYPNARIIGFEPDPTLLPLLYDNIERNRLEGVQIVEAALSNREGTLTLYAQGHASTTFTPSNSAQTFPVKTVRLHHYLNQPVDFLKMNIEGSEWAVLSDCEDVLPNVKEMVVEYHHFPQLERNLHEILALLHRTGFEYTITDFNEKRDKTQMLPFHLNALDHYYYVLIYARRSQNRANH
jgi:FkbM family methyltransferase